MTNDTPKGNTHAQNHPGRGSGRNPAHARHGDGETSHHSTPHKAKHHATKRHTSRIVHGARGPKGAAGPAGAPGKNGQDGTQGPAGQNGQNGQNGDSYLKGAYYSVAYYDKGDTNGGAIATVVCKAPTDTAISGGVSTDDYTKTVPVGQSFPGRMDWSTNTPKANRLDGWIVQFASQNGSAPEKVKVWALCVPGLDVSASQTYTQSIDG